MANDEANGVQEGEFGVTAGTYVTISVEDGESSSRGRKTQKDPTTIARRYQLELCKKALEENIIVYLGTGCGKTHIAVLLMYEMRHLIQKPQRNLCIFLAPTVHLVEQQASVIENSVDFKVKAYCGSSKRLRTHLDWEKETEQNEVFVMTPQILLRNLNHRFMKMEQIALLIFDECHHAQVQSNHPYAEIMKVLYKNNGTKLPRIFGMTASPVVGKGASDRANLAKSINSLENLLDAKVYSVEDKEELESFVASPKVKVYHYGPVTNSGSSSHKVYCKKLDEIKQQCISMLSGKATNDHKSLLLMKKMLRRMHDNLVICLINLGIWGALQASHILLKGDHSEWNELMEAEGNSTDNSLCDQYLTQATSVFSSEFMRDGVESEISSVEVLKEPFFSMKLLRLIGILSSFRLQPNMKCIVFVNRIVIARSLSYILQNLKFLASWKCDFLVGVHSGLKSVSRKATNIILEKFRSGELNLLVATKVGEEGLDIQTCCLVIRFDLPETVASFIQSRGRARMPQSEYAFLVDRGNLNELDLIEKFTKDEDRMKKEIVVRTSSETFVDYEEKIYKVDTSGASISSGYSISLLHHYCAKLPHDEYFFPKPEFFCFDDVDGTICYITLPSNAPIHHVVSRPQPSIEAARKEACLKACIELHKLGALNDYLLPGQEDENKNELVIATSDSDSYQDEGPRAELHEMLVPALLKEPWNNSEMPVHLNSYFIKFIPHPNDRDYKKFGLFVKAPLPAEAQRMELDLHLSHGRSVMTELVPLGLVEFDQDQLLQAQKFQEIFLKVMLERSELIPEFVALGKTEMYLSSSSTFYLLLPVNLHECKNAVAVDWNVVRRCLSSPIFRTPADAVHNGTFSLDNHLQLATGPTSIHDVKDSLVYAPYKKAFFFISGIIDEKNGHSTYKGCTSLVDHLFQTFKVCLSYPGQPLLKAKQLFSLHNLLHDRKQGTSELLGLEEHFFELPPELCQLKIIGFSKDIGSSISLLPSIMHRLENLLVAIELKNTLSASFPEGAEVTAFRVLQALTTEKCNERFSLERLEVLGDAFLKFAVGRRLFLLHDVLDEGELTRKRSNAVNNSNLFKLAINRNLQIYIRDQQFEPRHFIALGRPCSLICNKETEVIIHSQSESSVADCAGASEVRCSKRHHWLYKKTIADVVEALIGAFIVDSGFKAATAFLRWIGIPVDFEASQVTDVCIASNRYKSLFANMDFDALEDSLGYRFLHRGLLLQAFVHPSYNRHGGGCYQRLEFLGDAVMDYLITSYLYSVYPELKPGQLTDLRSMSVNNKDFASVAVRRSFYKFLISDSSSLSEAIEKYVDFINIPELEKHPLEGPKCPKALGDLVESCIGAILLDTGFDLKHVWKIMLSFLDPVVSFSSLQFSPIRELQELCQSHNWDLQFPVSKKKGLFVVEGKVTEKDTSGSEKVVCATTRGATNINKKDAIRIASEEILVKLKGRGYTSKSKLLEEFLKSSLKKEAELIGYDETPINVVSANSISFENLNVLESSFNGFNSKTHSDIRIKRVSGELPSSSKPATRKLPSETIEGSSQKRTAKSCLYEVCAANSWKAPLFECCKEEGQSHLRKFLFKVVMEVDEDGELVVCFGEPQSTKKAAAEVAAEAALWYLKGKGFMPKM